MQVLAVSCLRVYAEQVLTYSIISNFKTIQGSLQRLQSPLQVSSTDLGMTSESMITAGLRQDFLTGASGDCTLRFTVNGNLKVERKAHSSYLQHVPHFKNQLSFREGVEKTFTIEISDFIEPEISLEIGEFVDQCFLVLFDAKAKVDPSVDLKSRYAMVRFRDYLGFPYEKILEAALPDSAEDQRSIFENFLDQSSPQVFESLIKHQLKLLHTAAADDEERLSFDRRWKVAYDRMMKHFERREEHRAKCIAKALIDRFHKGCGFGWMRRGLGGGLVELLALFWIVHGYEDDHLTNPGCFSVMYEGKAGFFRRVVQEVVHDYYKDVARAKIGDIDIETLTDSSIWPTEPTDDGTLFRTEDSSIHGCLSELFGFVVFARAELVYRSMAQAVLARLPLEMIRKYPDKVNHFTDSNGDFYVWLYRETVDNSTRLANMAAFLHSKDDVAQSSANDQISGEASKRQRTD